jgi:hypothetical protein
MHTNERRTHHSYAQMPRVGSKPPWPIASVAFHKARAGVVRVTCIITRLSPWSRTGTIRSSWRSGAGFVKSAKLRWTLQSCSRLARPQSQLGSRGPKIPGTANQAVDGWAVQERLGGPRWRLPLTGRSRRDSIRGTGRHWPDEQPAQVLDTPARA